MWIRVQSADMRPSPTTPAETAEQFGRSLVQHGKAVPAGFLREDDVNILDCIVPEADSFYVMDRAYVDFSRLHVFHRCGAFFVTRTKKGILLRRRYSRPVDTGTGLRSDHTVVLATAASRKKYPDTLRRLRFFDEKRQRHLTFLTNNFDLPAITICHLYKSRWQVELFFESWTWCTPLDVM
jgi:hypothetical protein